MLPLKYDLVKLGGSWAQRQVFSVTLIHAAIRSNQLPLALALIAELKVWYGHHGRWLIGHVITSSLGNETQEQDIG